MAENNEEVIGMVVKLAAESTDFQNQMATLNRQMKVLQSDYKATSSSSKDFEKSLEGLEAKSKYLTQAITTQQNILEAHTSKLDKTKAKINDLANAQIELKGKLDSTKASYEQAVEMYGKESTEAKKLEEELKSLQTQYDKNNDKINATNKTLDNQTIAYNNARATMGNLETQLRETTNAMDQLGDETRDTSQDVEGIGGNGNPFGQFTGGVKEALGETKIFGVSLGDLGGALSGAIDLTTLLTGVVAGATAAFTELAIEGIKQAIAAMKQFIAEAIELGTQFQAQMSRVEAISGAVGTNVQKLTDSAREMGRETVYSAAEAAQGLEYMALAGWSAQESIEGLPAVLNLASAAGMDLGLASDIVTDYLTAFGMQVKDSQRLVDVMSYSMSHSNTNVEQLGEAYKNCASTCAGFGLSVEESTAWLSKMADAGKKGGEAGTALNSVLARMYGQNKKATDALERYGLSMYEANGKAKTFTETMREIQEAMKDMTDQEKNSFLRDVAGTNQLAAFNTMMAASADEVENFTNKLEAANGTAEKMSKTMNDNIAGLKKSINSKVEDLKLSIYTVLEPIISMVLKLVETILNNATQYMKPMSDLIAAILDPIRTIFNATMDIIQLINNKLLPILSGPLKAITSLLQGIGSVISAICNVVVTGVSTILEVLQPIIDVINWICDKVGWFFDLLASSINSIAESIKDPIKTIKTDIEYFKTFGSMFKNLLTFNTDAFMQDINKVDTIIEKGLDGLEEKVTEAENQISSNFKNIADVCGESTDTVWGSFEEMYEKIKELDDETFGQLKESAESYFNEYKLKMGGLDQYETDQLKKKMEKWEATHKSMEGTQNWYIKRAEYQAQEEERLANRTASSREKINNSYTTKMEQELKKQQGIQQKYSTDTYKADYTSFAKNEEEKTKKYMAELKKRQEAYGDGKYTADITGVPGWGNSDTPRYNSGTPNHPGGLAIVADGNGSNGELLNIPRGTQVHSNNDTSSLLKDASKGTESRLDVLIQEFSSLKQYIKEQSYQESSIIGMG